MLRRREFFALLGGGMAALPQALRAQQKGRVAHVGVLMNFSENDSEGIARASAFVQSLQALGWSDGRNLLISYRWGAGDSELFRKYAQELVTLAPDVILATGTPVVEALQRVTRIVPLVFVTVIDPVGAGFVESLAHPGGNTTGFTLFEFGLSGKWVELLKEIVPTAKRVAILRDSTIGSGTGQLAAIQAVAPSFGIELSPIGVRDAGEIERSVTAFASIPNGSLIVTASTLALVHRELIISLAVRHKLPAIYGDRTFVRAGGLISYGPNRIDPYRRAAEYVDRVLRGEKPSELPVQAPTRYELVVNLKVANALNLPMPKTVLTRADEVIE
jgi:putative ABC transport system substrate-binding protein